MSSSARRHDAIAVDADAEPLLLELLHQHLEALPFLAEQVLGRHAAVLEEELARVLRREAELLELPAAHEAGRVGLDEEQADALVRRACASGSVFTTTMKRSPSWPIEMKVLAPFTT